MRYLNNGTEARRCKECSHQRRPGFTMGEEGALFICLVCIKEAIEAAEKTGRYP